MSVSCKPRQLKLFFSDLEKRFKKELYAAYSLKNRDKSPCYDFFFEHGIVLTATTYDGTAVPDHIRQLLTFETPVITAPVPNPEAAAKRKQKREEKRKAEHDEVEVTEAPAVIVEAEVVQEVAAPAAPVAAPKAKKPRAKKTATA